MFGVSESPAAADAPAETLTACVPVLVAVLESASLLPARFLGAVDVVSLTPLAVLRVVVATACTLGAPLAEVEARSVVDTDVVRLKVRAPERLGDSVAITDGVRATRAGRVDCTDCDTDGEHVATLTDEPGGHDAGQPHAVGAPTPDAQNEPAGQRNAVAVHEPAGQ